MASRRKRERLSDAALFERMQSIVLSVAEGQRSIADDREYKDLRGQWRQRDLPMPHLVTTHPTLDSAANALKSEPSKKDRVARVREDFLAAAYPVAADNDILEAVGWTGNPDRVSRLRVIRQLLPQARSTVQTMIDELSKPGPNGGPLLDETEEALEHLRELHRALGELLDAIDSGRFDDDLGQGLAAEAARSIKQAAKSLRDDPLPHAVALLIYGIFTACGFPGVGSQLGSSAKDILKKHAKAG